MSSPVGTRQRILLVEDDASNAVTLAALLEDIGCIVDVAASLAAARRLLAQTGYAAVLLDHHLGDGQGTELLPLLRGRHPPTPVVHLSGAAEPPARWQDFAAMHVKGTDPEDLLSTVRRLLSMVYP